MANIARSTLFLRGDPHPQPCDRRFSSVIYNRPMVDSSKLALFLTAALLLAVAPGPGMLYVLARSLAGGRREGVLSALGTFVGGMVHVLAAAAGVSVVLARSAVAFATVKYAGAAYLCFLGVRMILAASRDKDELPTAVLPPARNPFWQGIATEVLNPKTALFFLSFIPQFVNREAGHVFAISRAGRALGHAEPIGRFGSDDVCGPVGKPDTLLCEVPP